MVTMGRPNVSKTYSEAAIPRANNTMTERKKRQKVNGIQNITQKTKKLSKTNPANKGVNFGDSEE